MDAHPWNYCEEVRARLPGSDSLLDIGTGDGELLASMAPLPPRTTAVEGYAPMVPIAKKRLAPLGVDVVVPADTRGPLPFEDGTFDAVIDARAFYSPGEIARVLSTGGWFLTEQVGSGNDRELYELLTGEQVPLDNDPQIGADELRSVGMQVNDVREAFIPHHFLDIWGVVYYLRLLPWNLPDFSVDRYRPGLRRVYDRIEADGEFTAQSRRFLLVATKA